MLLLVSFKAIERTTQNETEWTEPTQVVADRDTRRERRHDWEPACLRNDRREDHNVTPVTLG